MATWEGLCNQALRRIGTQKRIGWAHEGSEVAKACLENFSQVRDNLIRSGDWDFARRTNVTLTLYKGPPPQGGYGPWAPWTPAYPPPGWNYEYLYPSDCIRFAAVVPPPTTYPILLPRPANWVIFDDWFSATGAQLVQPVKVISANMPNAMCSYYARITNPSLWDSGFTESFIDALAEALSVPLGLNQNLQLKQAEEQKEAVQTPMTEQRRG